MEVSVNLGVICTFVNEHVFGTFHICLNNCISESLGSTVQHYFGLYFDLYVVCMIYYYYNSSNNISDSHNEFTFEGLPPIVTDISDDTSTEEQVCIYEEHCPTPPSGTHHG